jgi:hypothetical protein
MRGSLYVRCVITRPLKVRHKRLSDSQEKRMVPEPVRRVFVGVPRRYATTRYQVCREFL